MLLNVFPKYFIFDACGVTERWGAAERCGAGVTERCGVTERWGAGVTERGVLRVAAVSAR
jgi:hypothetical protein